MAEVEAKFALTPEGARDLVVILGDPHKAIQQFDTYFNTPAGFSLRIRQETLGAGVQQQRRAFLTLKGSVPTTSDGILSLDEIEPEIDPDDVEMWSSIFQRMGLSLDVVVGKMRQEYQIDLAGYQGKLVIDLVDNLGHFCELEIVDDDADSARQALADAIIELGLNNLVQPGGSYRYLLKQTLGG